MTKTYKKTESTVIRTYKCLPIVVVIALFSSNFFKYVWQITKREDSQQCKNGHFADQQCWKTSELRLFFQKITLEQKTEDQAGLDFFNNSYLIPTEVVLTARFQPPKYDNNMGFGKRVKKLIDIPPFCEYWCGHGHMATPIPTPLFINVILRPTRFRQYPSRSVYRMGKGRHWKVLHASYL